MERVFCCQVPLTNHPETRGEINEKTVSICIDPYQRKIPTDSRTDSTECSEYDIIFSVQYAWSLVCVPQ